MTVRYIASSILEHDRTLNGQAGLNHALGAVQQA